MSAIGGASAACGSFFAAASSFFASFFFASSFLSPSLAPLALLDPLLELLGEAGDLGELVRGGVAVDGAAAPARLLEGEDRGAEAEQVVHFGEALAAAREVGEGVLQVVSQQHVVHPALRVERVEFERPEPAQLLAVELLLARRGRLRPGQAVEGAHAVLVGVAGADEVGHGGGGGGGGAGRARQEPGGGQGEDRSAHVHWRRL